TPAWLGRLAWMRRPGLTMPEKETEEPEELGASVLSARPVGLEVACLTQRFGGVTALSEVDLSVAPGQVVGLLGRTGVAQSTLIDSVTGFAKPETGTVRLGGQDVSGWSATRRARAGLTRTFQSLELFDDITVRENLLVAGDQRGRWRYLTDLLWPGRSSLTP